MDFETYSILLLNMDLRLIYYIQIIFIPSNCSDIVCVWKVYNIEVICGEFSYTEVICGKLPYTWSI